jgi:hypothetical protein
VQQTLAVRWDGARWATAPTPNPSAGIDRLWAVSAASASDVWAVGEQAATAGWPSSRLLVTRWDGSAWHAVAPPPLPGTADHAVATGVVALSAGSVWVSGYDDDFTENPTSGILGFHARWDGLSWTVTTHNQGTAWAGAGRAGSQAIVVGAGRRPWTAPSAIPRRRCTRAAVVAVTCRCRRPGDDTGELLDASGTSATDAWAVGYHHPWFDRGQPVINRRDGTRWAFVPPPAGLTGTLEGVSAGERDSRGPSDRAPPRCGTGGAGWP